MHEGNWLNLIPQELQLSQSNQGFLKARTSLKKQQDQSFGKRMFSWCKNKNFNAIPQGFRLSHYFTLVNHVSQDTCFILYLEEKATIPAEYSDLHLHSKGFLPEIEVQDFPIRGKAVYLRIKRRRWEDPSTGQTYSRDWSLVATGTRITAEFGAFLKELLR